MTAKKPTIKRSVTLQLPIEFIALCRHDRCSRSRRYERVGWPRMNKR